MIFSLKSFISSLLLLEASQHYAIAFAPVAQNGGMKTLQRQRQRRYSSTMQLEEPAIGFENSCYISQEDSSPIVTLGKGSEKEKVVNSHGLKGLLATIILNPIWSLAMYITDKVCNAVEGLDENRSFYDTTGKIWAKSWLTMIDSYPTVSGDVERLKESNDLGACLFVANHASWLDIPVLCTVLDPVFKFIAKGELKSVPCIGQQLTGGNHILIDREDRRSQLRTFKEGVAWLNKGVPLMAFPEGMRSSDGRLMEFKGGIFSMAVRAGVPIVPLSISNTHAVMPGYALFPIQKGAGKLHVHVHEPISIEGTSEAELAELVKVALLSKLPLEQHPLPSEINEEDAKDDVEDVNTKNLVGTN